VQADPGAAQFAPVIAMAASGNFLIAWQAFESGDLDVQARPFAANGTPLSEAFTLNSPSSGNQKSPALAMNAAGSFAAAWHSDTTSDWNIAARTSAPIPPTESRPP
jgi:hypothetical protein